MNRIAVALLFAVGVADTPAAYAQAKPAVNFEVASLKPSVPGGRGGGIRPAPGGERYLATNVSLRVLIMVAYRVKNDQVIGGPSWVDTELYDMNAKAERPSNIEDLHVMLQNLLADRFKLKFHRETKELPVYALSVDKNGPKMQAHEAQSAGDPWIDQATDKVTHIKLSARFVPMDYFAWRLGQLVDRPVIDRTNLKGGFDFGLTYTRELPLGIQPGALLNGEPIDTSGPNLFEALRQQLGLRLESQKGPVDVLMIDRAEKPVEN